jgi:CBS domain-containing protein
VETQPVFLLDCNQSMEEVYQKMRSENVRHLAISEKEKIVGLLSIKDF